MWTGSWRRVECRVAPKLKSRWMHKRGRVGRNAGQAGGREGVNARRLVRREEQQRRVNEIAQNSVEGRASTEQDGEHDEGAQQGHGSGH